MENQPFIQRLRNIIPVSSISWITAALRQDKIVWSSLEEDEFGQKALSQCGGNSQTWSPANLWVLAMQPLSGDPPLTSQNLQADINFALESDLRRSAGQAYESLNQQSPAAVSVHTEEEQPASSLLAHSGMLALALRERRRLLGSWEGLVNELRPVVKTNSSLKETWGTTLACLAGMLPDPLELLLSLLSPFCSTDQVDLALHALLSQPQPQEKQAEILQNLVSSLDFAQRIGLIRRLSLVNPRLAQGLAQQVVVASTADAKQPCAVEPAGALQDVTRLETLLHYIYAYRTAAQPEQILPNITTAWETTHRLQAELAAEKAWAARQQGDLEGCLASWKQALDIQTAYPRYRAEYCLELIGADRLDEAARYLEETSQPNEVNAGLLYASALLQQRSNQLDQTRETARKAYDALTNRNNREIDDDSDHLASDLASLCLDLEMPKEAVQSAQVALLTRPNDPDLQAILGKAECAAGNLTGAILAFHLAVSLSPERLDLQRSLAEYLELAKQFDNALVERLSIIQAQDDQLPTDLHAYAQCALWAGQPSQAASACQQALSTNPEDGLAHALIGQALSVLGDPLNARQHLSQATQLRPDYAPSWLLLARLHHEGGAGSSAIDTLRSASQAIPNSAEVYLSLGEAYQEDWEELGHPSPTQALSMFQQASSLAGRGKVEGNTAFQIALRLGQTLQQLGHIWEAHQALEPAYQQAPDHPGLAYAYATNLLALDQPHQALEPLTRLLASNPSQPEPYLDYARALLAIKGEPDKAIHALQAALALDASHAEARGLLAEAIAASGDQNAALLAYQEALETNLVEDPEWSTRLSLGLGRVALALHQPDIAIAALQEAGQADPHNAQIQHLLAEAYQAGGLIDDAIQAALATLRLSSDDPDRLTWFAETIMNLVQKKSQTAQPAPPDPENPEHSFHSTLQLEAMNAVSRAIQLAPQRSDLLVRLGNVQTWAGDLSGAVETFRMAVVQKDSSAEILHQAGRNLLLLHDSANAVSALDRACRLLGDKAFKTTGPGSLATDLIDAYRQAGDLQAALGMLNQVLAVSPADTALHRIKINILLELGQPAEALTCLQYALALPTNPDVHQEMRLQAANILRSLGRLSEALSYTEEWLVNASPLSTEAPSLSTRALAASLALAMLQPEKARQLLGGISSEAIVESNEPASNLTSCTGTTNPSRYDYYCLMCEIALSFEEPGIAAEAFTSAAKVIPPELPHTRLLALKSRLTLRQGDREAAMTLLQEALASSEKINNIGDRYDRAAIAQASAEAALELSHWDSATFLFRQACEALPGEALPHLHLARALTLRAEAQQLYQSVDVMRHAPGLASLAEHAYRSYQTAIDSAASTCPSSTPASQILARWRARGQAIFQPNQLSAQALAALSAFPLSPDDVAAQIASQRMQNNSENENTPKTEDSTPPATLSPYTLAVQTAHTYPTHPLVMAQLALALAIDQDHRQDALAVILQTAEKTPPTAENEISPIYLSANYLPEAVWQALVGKIAEQAGDQALAQQAIQAALNIWPDEPRWHCLAARCYHQSGEFPAAIHHLEQAVALEPEYIPHSLALGQAYLESPSPDDRLINQAILVLEKARHLAPEQPDTWLALARAHQTANDLAQAASCADQAITLAPDQPQAVILRAEIALQAGQPQEAHDRLQFLLTGNRSISNAEEQCYESSPIQLLARSLVELDRNDEALALIEKALPQTKDPLPLLLERARIIQRTQGGEAAAQALQELAHIYPNEPVVLGSLAKMLYDANRNDEAIPMAQRALQASSQSMKEEKRLNLCMVEQAELHLLLGRLLRHAGQLDQALHHLNEAIHKDARLLESYLELGRAHQERRQPNLALQIYKQATMIAPHDPRPYYQAGLALKDSKDYLGAETMLRRAASLAPNDLSIHRQLGAVVALNLVHNRRHILTSIEDV